nr:uncharacterized protein LOC127303421 [Lolium perenne]
MAEETPVTYEELTGEPTKKHNKAKAVIGTELIGSYGKTRSHGIRLDGDTRPLPGDDTVDLSHSIREPGFSFDANMAGFVIRHGADKAESSHARGREKEGAGPRDRPQDDNKRYLAKEEVRNPQRPRSFPEHLLSKYDQPYDRHHRYGEGEQKDHRSDADGRYRRTNGHDDGYERRAGGRSEGSDNSKRTESSQEEDFEESGREEDRYRQPRRCPDGPSQSRERRVQRPRSLEEAEARYFYMLRISRPDLAAKIQRMVETRARPPKKVWRLKQAEADAQASTDADADASVDTDVAQEGTTYEQRHPESYQDKCRRVTLIEKDEDEGPARDQEFTNVEWTRGAKPESCKGAKQPGPAKGFDFDLSKTEQIFDWLLKEKQLKLPDGHRIPTLQEITGQPYCKWCATEFWHLAISAPRPPVLPTQPSSPPNQPLCPSPPRRPTTAVLAVLAAPAQPPHARLATPPHHARLAAPPHHARLAARRPRCPPQEEEEVGNPPPALPATGGGGGPLPAVGGGPPPAPSSSTTFSQW